MSKHNSPSEKLQRKRMAARLRQQRCRERKRLALLKEVEKRNKNKDTPLRTSQDMGTFAAKLFFHQRSLSPQVQFDFNYFKHAVNMAQMPQSLENFTAVPPSHFVPSPVKATPARPPSPEETAIDAMLSLKRSN